MRRRGRIRAHGAPLAPPPRCGRHDAPSDPARPPRRAAGGRPARCACRPRAADQHAAAAARSGRGAADASDADERPPAGTATTAAEPETPPAVEDDDDEDGCLIATAAYGTEIAPQAQHLRDLRLCAPDDRGWQGVHGRARRRVLCALAAGGRPGARAPSDPPGRGRHCRADAPALQAVDLAEPGSELGVVAYGALAIALVAGMCVAAPAEGAWYAVRLGRRTRSGRRAH